MVCPRDERHGPHDDEAKFCSRCGHALLAATSTRRYACSVCEFAGPLELPYGEPAPPCPACRSALAPVDLPADVLVHWPSGPVACCEPHATQLISLGKFMGTHVVATRLLELAECVNCVNEGPPA